MLLDNKKIVIMGIRNKWSIAYGVAQSAYKNGAKLIFIYRGEKNKEKIEKLTEEFEGSSCYTITDATDELSIKQTLTQIKNDNGKIDGIVHLIANAKTEDLHGDFINTSMDGFNHALDVSCYSFILVSRIAKELDMLNENASLITYSYYGAKKVVKNYNVMGIAKAALESSVRYLANDLGKYSYRVNAISAGPIKTLSAKGISDFDSILDAVETKSPLQKNVTAEQVGDVATFLLSNLSSCVTGQIIYADNGYNIIGA